uniref:Uncharacterized protein n=1 Tax=Anguilla anguilla TaxID=7936 RepID=A0A0E9V1F7_ANGAN
MSIEQQLLVEHKKQGVNTPALRFLRGPKRVTDAVDRRAPVST